MDDEQRSEEAVLNNAVSTTFITAHEQLPLYILYYIIEKEMIKMINLYQYELVPKWE